MTNMQQQVKQRQKSLKSQVIDLIHFMLLVENPEFNPLENSHILINMCIITISVFILTIYWLTDWFNDWFGFERYLKYMVYLLPMMLVILLIQSHWNDRQRDWHKTNCISEQSTKRRTLLYSSLQASEVRVSEGMEFDTPDELSVTAAVVPVLVAAVTQ